MSRFTLRVLRLRQNNGGATMALPRLSTLKTPKKNYLRPFKPTNFPISVLFHCIDFLASLAPPAGNLEVSSLSLVLLQVLESKVYCIGHCDDQSIHCLSSTFPKIHNNKSTNVDYIARILKKTTTL